MTSRDSAGIADERPLREPLPASSIRVLVVDDHPIMRAGIVGVLGGEAGIAVVGEAADGEAAWETVRAAGPDAVDVVLMDLRMPVLDGASATERIRALPGPPAVVVLTTYDTDADILRAVEAGATGYLLKDAPRAELVAAVRAAAAGQSTLAPHVATRLVATMHGHASGLTPRERDVLRAVARGEVNAAIARRLGITEATVKTHLLRSFAKLGARDRTHAVVVALERGELDLADPGT